MRLFLLVLTQGLYGRLLWIDSGGKRIVLIELIVGDDVLELDEIRKVLRRTA